MYPYLSSDLPVSLLKAVDAFDEISSGVIPIETANMWYSIRDEGKHNHITLFYSALFMTVHKITKSKFNLIVESPV